MIPGSRTDIKAMEEHQSKKFGEVEELRHVYHNHEGIEYSVSYSYLAANPTSNQPRGTVVLLHGFPNTKYQFRHVLKPLARANYNVITPDWPVRKDSPPAKEIQHTFEKSYVAANIREFLTSISVKKPIHLVAHDMAAQVAIRLAIEPPIIISTLTWGEAIITGTNTFQTLMDSGKLPWHFKFHALPDLPEQMIAGKEEVYIKYFFDVGCAKDTRANALSSSALAVYAEHMSDPGNLQGDLAMYRAFPADMVGLGRSLERFGVSKLPVLIVNGGQGFIRHTAVGQARELHREGSFEVKTVEGAGHYVAEEAPEQLVRVICKFTAQHE